MEREKNETAGNLKISQDVLATIAGFATKEIEGVAGMSTAPTALNIKNFITKSQSDKSINIEMNDDVATVDVYVNLKYGAKIPLVSEKIQKSVKNAIQSMTGIIVSRVNVHVNGIAFDSATAGE